MFHAMKYRLVVALIFTVIVQSGCDKKNADNNGGGNAPIVAPNDQGPKNDAQVGAQIIPPRTKFVAGFPNTFNPKTLDGDKPAVVALYISADGKRVAMSNRSLLNKKIEVWDIESEPKRVLACDGIVEAISPDGKRIVQYKGVGGNVVEIDTGKELSKLKFDVVPMALCFRSPDRIVGVRMRFQEFNALNGEVLHSFEPAADGRIEITPLANNREGAIGLVDANLVRVWDFETRAKIRDVPLPNVKYSPSDPKKNSTWYGFSFSPNGKYFAMKRSSDPVELFDAATGALVASAPRGVGPEWSAFHPIRDFYICPSNALREDRTGNSLDFVAFDITKKSLVAAFRGHDTGNQSIAISADGNVMATGDSGGNVFIWDLRQLK